MMSNFRNNQMPAPNPYIVRSGGSDAYGPLGSGFYGLGIIGAMNPAQALTSLDYYIPPYPGEVTGYATIWAEVIDWPFTEDDEGVSFDSGLRGIRTVCARQPIADGGGDSEDQWIAVPATIPGGYTSCGRCGILAPLYENHLSGISVSTAANWNHRTPTGYRWDTSTPDGAARSAWGPMNIGQQTLNGGVSFIGAGAVPEVYDPVNDGYDNYPYAYMASSHVGFRGGRIELTYINAGPAWPVTVRREFTIQAWQITDPAWTIIEHPPASKETLFSISASHTFAAPGADYTETFTLPELTHSAIGIPCDFVLVARSYIQEGFGPGSSPPGQDAFLGHFVFAQWLSPRTDVPPWFFISTGSKCAQGGYVAP